MQYTTLLWDADNTLFDFDRGEEQAFSQTFSQMGIAVTSELFSRYYTINKSLWKAFEEGKMEKEFLVVERFRRLCEAFALELDPVALQNRYVSHLSMADFVLEGVYEMLDALSPRYALYIITNGVAENQYKRLASSNLRRYFQGVIVSEEAGAAKPSTAFFDHAFSHLPLPAKEQVLVIGDSLSADIQGANNYGLDSIWFNPKNLPLQGKAIPTHTMASYAEILHFLR